MTTKETVKILARGKAIKHDHPAVKGCKIFVLIHKATIHVKIKFDDAFLLKDFQKIDDIQRYAYSILNDANDDGWEEATAEESAELRNEVLEDDEPENDEEENDE